LLMTVVGVFLGTKVLVTSPLWILNLCLGVMVLMFVFSNWLRFELTISPKLERKLSAPAGLIGGFLNGMTNAGGPALAIYLYNLRLPKLEFINPLPRSSLLRSSAN